jgi:ribosomal protein S18 acetylase RimI-like enzyme
MQKGYFMRVISLHDRQQIAAFLHKNPHLHNYALGDLDDFFWPYTQWYGLEDSAGEIVEIVLMYHGGGKGALPVLLAITDDSGLMRVLLEGMIHLLPQRFYSHLSDGLDSFFTENGYHAENHGGHAKMRLESPQKIAQVDVQQVRPITLDDLDAVQALYSVAYPNNSFDPRMVKTGQYFGVYKDHQWVSVAGIHVYSPRYQVAALGNITTHPAYRGQGLALITTAKLCQSLAENVQHISLNVRADNRIAIRCYETLGFVRFATYGEFTMTRL